MGVLLIDANLTTPWYACPRVRAWMIGIVVVLWCGTAHAHQASLTHSDVVVDGDTVRYAILIAPADLDQSAGPTPAHLAYVLDHIEIADGDTPCPAEDAALVAEGAFTRVTWTARCPAPIARLVIAYAMFFEHDPTHEAVLRVHAAGDDADTLLADGHARFVWDLAGAPPSGTLAFVRSGVDHILDGFDHICFLLALLVAIVIARPAGGAWALRSVGQTLGATAILVTSFTVAHSITLIAASLGAVDLPARLVETIIALSIAYTAVENLIRPDVRWRHVLTFGFGLLHGLGFARMLEVLLPPDDVVVPLLAFNVGVELGQLVIVAIALPVVMLLARGLGAERYRRLALPVVSAALAILGVLWLVERLFEVTILGL